MSGVPPEKGVKGPSTGTLDLIFPYFRRYALRVSVGFCSLLGVDFLQLLIPRVVKKAVDAMQTGTATGTALLGSGAKIVLLAIMIACFRFGWRYLILGFSRLLERDLRNRLFAHLIVLDRPFFQRHPPGELMALATNDLAAVQLACGMGLVACADAVVMTVAAVSFMAYIHPTLTLIAVAPMPVLAVLTRLLAGRLHQRFKRVQEQFSMLSEFARTSMSTIRLIKAYTQESVQAGRFDRMGRRYVRDNFRLAIVQGILFPVSGFIGNASLLLVFVFGGRLVVGGMITAGDFVAFISYLFMLTWPMMAIGWVTNLFQRGITSLGRIRTILAARPLLSDPPVSAPVPEAKGIFRIRDLTFHYPQQTAPALKDINIDIGLGILGIVGRTGSGKTTLCHLLARQYPVADNTIFLDGADVNRRPLAAVRSRIAYVPQEVILFAETLAANIAMGKPGAAPEEIEAAARAAAVHDEIIAMPDGYQTRVGERGVKLSGGQRQRIALARALLLKRPVIIIDDGLSAVDMETEHRIIGSMAPYLRDRTCIIVSHRLAPLADAREIIVMDHGRIVARGGHDHLCRHSPFYRTIFEYQLSTKCSAG